MQLRYCCHDVRNTQRGYSTVDHIPFLFSCPFCLDSPIPIPTWCETKGTEGVAFTPARNACQPPPVQKARFPRGISFPPHVASPIQSDLSSPAKEWDRLVAGASPLDCLFVGISYAGGFKGTGHNGGGGFWLFPRLSVYSTV